MTSRKTYKIMAVTISTIAILLLLTSITIIVFSPREERITGDANIVNIAALYCQSKITEQSFFEKTTEKSVLHEIKVTLKDGKADQIDYTYHGVFESTKEAEEAEAVYQFAYGNYLGKNGLSITYLSPSFSVLDNELIINIAADNEKFSSGTARIFSLEGNKKLSSYSRKDLETFYKGAGYTCEYSG